MANMSARWTACATGTSTWRRYPGCSPPHLLGRPPWASRSAAVPAVRTLAIIDTNSSGDRMKEFPFPVRVVGAGSQPTEEEELQYLPMPSEMNTFRMPLVPEDADAAALRGARDVLAEFLERLIAWDPAAQGRGPNLDLEGLPSAVLRIVNDMLGDGEVSIRSDGTHRFRIQESVFTGVWRVC